MLLLKYSCYIGSVVLGRFVVCRLCGVYLCVMCVSICVCCVGEGGIWLVSFGCVRCSSGFCRVSMLLLSVISVNIRLMFRFSYRCRCFS